MKISINENFLTRWVFNLVFKVSSVFRNIRRQKNRVLAEQTSKTIQLEADKTKSLEIQHWQGSSGDSLRDNVQRIFLPDWAKEIEPFLANQLSDHTRRAYENDLKQFFRFLETKIDLSQIHGLKPEHVILFRKNLEEGRVTGEPLEKSSINRKLAVVKSFLNWLKLNQVISDNPAQLVKGYPQNQESDLKGLSDDEVMKILDFPIRNTRSGAMHYAALYCLLYLGLRRSELIGLRMGDLTTERGVPVIKVRGKGHKIRILPLTDAVVRALEHYFFVCRRDRTFTESPLFVPTKNPRTQNLEKELNPNSITYIVIRYAKKAGVLKKISPHSCRATCISNALDKKATHRSVQYMAGWSSPLMIQRYDKRREDIKNSAAYLIDYKTDDKQEGPGYALDSSSALKAPRTPIG